MATKTIRTAISNSLDDLSEEDFGRFCFQLVDLRGEPRVRRNRVQGKKRFEIADVLVSTFCEDRALQVTEEILKGIGCSSAAEDLVADMAEHSSQCGDTARPSAGATSVNTVADDEHFVDKHRVELIKRVSYVAPILDQLLAKKVIQEESYDQVMALPTSQEKMRTLYSGCLKSGDACKDVFYEILVENEPYLIDDLKKKKWCNTVFLKHNVFLIH